MREITLFGGKIALVDDDDYWDLMQYRWSEGRYGRRGQIYAKCNEPPFLMHKFIMGFNPGFVVDHIDGNPLNNQRLNLRWKTNASNIQRQPKLRGKSKFKGVLLRKDLKSKPWRAEIVVNYNRRYLGYFASEEEAAQAYDRAAIEAFGPDAYINFSDNLANYLA